MARLRLAPPPTRASPAFVQPLDEEMNEHKKLQVIKRWLHAGRLACVRRETTHA